MNIKNRINCAARLSIINCALSITLLAGCQQEEALQNTNFPADGVIRITTRVDAPETRAGYTTENLRSFCLKITTKDDAGNVDSRYSYFADIKKDIYDTWNSHNAKDGSPLTMLWKSNTQKITATAIMRPDQGMSETMFNAPQIIGVYSDQTIEKNVMYSDYLYMAPTEIDPTQPGALTADGKLPITLSHLYSKVNITLTLGTELNVVSLPVANPVSALVIGGTKKSNSFTPATNKWEEANNIKIGPITPTTTGYTAPSSTIGKAVATYEAILVPQTVEAGTFGVSFTMGGKLYEWKSPSAVTLESGKQHALALTVGKDFVVADEIATTPWTDGVGGKLETE